MSQTTVPPADHPGHRLLIEALIVGVVLGGTLLIPKAYDAYTQYQEAKASATAAEASASAYASAQASATNAVPDGTQVCELLDSTDLEERTGLQIVFYSTARYHFRLIPSYSCYIYFAQPNSDIAEIIIISYDPIPSPERSFAEYLQSYADNSEISPVSMNGLPGEAFSYTIDGAERITWRSPKGAQMSIEFTYTESVLGAEDPEGAHEILLDIFYQVVPIIDEVAAGPPLLLTVYPPGPTATPTP